MEKNTPDCCKPRKSNGFWQGLLYGLFPHAGCIAFIAASALGMATFASVFRPLLMKGYFFYIMIALSFVFATLSAYLYLKKQGGIKNAKHHKGYLSILYGTTIGISLLMYFVVFPAMASAQFGSSTSNTLAGTSNIPTESELQTQASLEQVTLNVNIPCAGHGPLITGALKEINGVTSVRYLPISKFVVQFNPSKTSKEQILGISIFREYPATIVPDKVFNP